MFHMNSSKNKTPGSRSASSSSSRGDASPSTPGASLSSSSFSAASTSGSRTPAFFRGITQSSFSGLSLKIKTSSLKLRHSTHSSKTTTFGGYNSPDGEYVLESLQVNPENERSRSLLRHKNGYALASGEALKPIKRDHRLWAVLKCAHVEHTGMLAFRVKNRQALPAKEEPLEEDHDHDQADTLSVDGAGSVVSKVSKAPASPHAVVRTGSKFLRDASTTRRKNKIAALLAKNKIAKVDFDDDHILISLPDKSASRGRMSTKRGGGVGGLTLRSSASGVGSFDEEEVDAAASPAQVYRQLHRFELAHIYAIEHPPGEKEFNLVFKEPGCDFENPEEKVFSTQDFSFKVLTLKAQSVEEASHWLEKIFKGVENQGRVAAGVAKQLEKDTQQAMAVHREGLLRQSVDMWSLAKGVHSLNAAEAQQKLIDYLLTTEEGQEEARYWEGVIRKTEARFADDDVADGVSL